MSIGTFMITKNEAPWIAAHILSVLPHVDEMVFWDSSDDGTAEIIQAISKDHPDGKKIMLSVGGACDPKDLQDDYVRVFNECLHSLSTDLAWFLHPDMIISRVPRDFNHLENATAASVAMRSFGGEPDGPLYEMGGRGKEWKSIYRLRNPDLGAHYFGHYGHTKEDVYFSAITGDQHVFYDKFENYPYVIVPSGIEVLHFSDVRPRARRIDRMVKCLLNNNWPKDKAAARARTHPRVTFKNEENYTFTPTQYPEDFVKARNKYRHLERSSLVKA